MIIKKQPNKDHRNKEMTCEISRQLQAQYLANNYSDRVLFSVY